VASSPRRKGGVRVCPTQSDHLRFATLDTSAGRHSAWADDRNRSFEATRPAWRGLWLEGSATRIEQIRKNFQAFLDERRLAVSEAFVAAENINALLDRGGVTAEIDLLSIDIDNNDYWVWKAITVIQPRVVVIEYDAALRPPPSLVVPYELPRYFFPMLKGGHALRPGPYVTV
jgi:hypothetical protein